MKGEVKLRQEQKECVPLISVGAGSTIIGSISLLQIFITASLPCSHPFPLPDPVMAQSCLWSQPTTASVMNVANIAGKA